MDTKIDSDLSEERPAKPKLDMECYATSWRLWRESLNLKIFIEPSFPVNAPLYLYLKGFFLSFCHFNRVYMHAWTPEGLPERLQ